MLNKAESPRHATKQNKILPNQNTRPLCAAEAKQWRHNPSASKAEQEPVKPFSKITFEKAVTFASEWQKFNCFQAGIAKNFCATVPPAFEAEACFWFYR